MKSTILAITALAFAASAHSEDLKVVPMDDWVRGLPLKTTAAPGQYAPNGKILHITFHHTHTEPGDGTRETEITILNNQVHSSSLYTWEKDAPDPVTKKDRYYRRKGADGGDVPKHGGTAYHYLIGNSGTIYKGRPDDIAPASNTYYYSSEELAGATYDVRVAVVLRGAMKDRVLAHRNAAFETWKSRTDYPEWLEGERRVLRRQQVKETGLEKALAVRVEEQKNRLVAPGHSRGHLTVSFIGGDAKPSAKALESAARLTARLLREHGLAPEAVRTHREVANTKCPGEGVQGWIRQQPGTAPKGALFDALRKLAGN